MNQDLRFDAQLPELPLALDAGAVGDMFAGRWRADGLEQRIRSCRLQDVKYQPGRRCVTTYALTVEGAAGAEQTIGVVELTPAGLACRLYSDDPQLPWLGEAGDPGSLAPRFAALLGAPVVACAVTPVRYRPGTRCVFRYEVETRVGRAVIFGKLLREGAVELAATLTALHQASQTSPAMPRVLAPLDFWPELQLILQPEVAGRAELNDLAFSQEIEPATREHWLREAGARLASLHSADLAAPVRRLEDDLEELREYVAPVAAANPDLAARYEAAVARVAELGRGRGEPAAVASHGAFRTDQFMIEGERLVLIDLDGFCRANAARDIGNFLAYLRWKAIRQPRRAALIERAGELFLDGYRAARPGADAGWLAIYQAASLLKIAGRRYRSLTVNEWPLTPALLDEALALMG